MRSRGVVPTGATLAVIPTRVRSACAGPQASNVVCDAAEVGAVRPLGAACPMVMPAAGPVGSGAARRPDACMANALRPAQPLLA